MGVDRVKPELQVPPVLSKLRIVWIVRDQPRVPLGRFRINLINDAQTPRADSALAGSSIARRFRISRLSS